MKDERTEPKEMDTNQPKDPQQWDLDYSLEPFTGLTPEYMEMSKTSEFPFCNNSFFIGLTNTYCMTAMTTRKYFHSFS